MGRWINGSFEKKLWFGVQDSDDANYYGKCSIRKTDGGEEMVWLWTIDDLEEIEYQLELEEKALGWYDSSNPPDFDTNMLNWFCNHFRHEGKNVWIEDFDRNDFHHHELVRIARWELGMAIRSCLMEYSVCRITTEV